MKYTNYEKSIISERYWKVNTEFLELDFDTKLNRKVLDMFSKTIKLAETSSHDYFKVGAIITTNNRVISKKTNEYKTHPLQHYYSKKINTLCNNGKTSPRIHAEVNAIANANKLNKFNPRHSTIYIGRTSFDSNSTILSSFPCKICFGAIRDIGIGKIVCYDPFCRIVTYNLRCD